MSTPLNHSRELMRLILQQLHAAKLASVTGKGH